jgi:hypothetical protein
VSGAGRQWQRPCASSPGWAGGGRAACWERRRGPRRAAEAWRRVAPPPTWGTSSSWDPWRPAPLSIEFGDDGSWGCRAGGEMEKAKLLDDMMSCPDGLIGSKDIRTVWMFVVYKLLK